MKISRRAAGVIGVCLVALALSGCDASPGACFGPLERLSPDGAIQPTAQWGLGSKAGPFVVVAGMRGIDPATNEIVLDLAGRVRQAYTNMLLIAADAGAQADDLIETVVYIRSDPPHPSADFLAIRSLDNDVRQELYGDGPYPNRTIVGVTELNGIDPSGEVDVFEMKGTFYVPCD
ncbi:MAG: RidA family protein [Candidatus Rariloculaceae bacterium]